ncbi:MAG: hypothetical protein ABIW31_02740 [Novosphingobium sp.]
MAASFAFVLMLASATGPSFGCGTMLQPTEKMICEDDELAASDRAQTMVWLTTSKKERAPQRHWLAERDKCGANRQCLFDKYDEWFESNQVDWQPSFDRKSGPKFPASLTIRPVGGDWYAFSVNAFYFYKMRDGGESVNDGGAWGVIHLVSGVGHYPAHKSAEACSFTLSKVSQGWRIDDSMESCGGLHVTLDGNYRLHLRRR